MSCCVNNGQNDLIVILSAAIIFLIATEFKRNFCHSLNYIIVSALKKFLKYTLQNANSFLPSEIYLSLRCAWDYQQSRPLSANLNNDLAISRLKGIAHRYLKVVRLVERAPACSTSAPSISIRGSIKIIYSIETTMRNSFFSPSEV